MFSIFMLSSTSTKNLAEEFGQSIGVEINSTMMKKVLLLGDSLVADNDWQRRMPKYQTYNFGTPGEMTADLLSYLPDIKDQQHQADVIMLMIGTNDLLVGNFEFIHALKKIVVQINELYPRAELLLCSILPMQLPHLPYNTVSSLNSHIEALTMQTGCCFLNIHERCSNSDKEIFQFDGVHLTEEAYEIWTRTLLEHIAFLIEDD